MKVDWDSVECDLVELSTGCVEQCSHCSESPILRASHAPLAKIQQGLDTLLREEAEHGLNLFSRYWLPFPGSDPFASPYLFAICDELWRRRGLQVYLLTLGWNRTIGTRTVRQFIEHSSPLFRITITISNFSKLASKHPELHEARLAESISDLRPLWDSETVDGRPLVQISPQYVEGLPSSETLSRDSTAQLIHNVCHRAGLLYDAWERERRIHWRAVTGLGRARTVLGVTTENELQVVPEHQAPNISLNPQRPNSAMITAKGGIDIYPGRRGALGRLRNEWVSIEQASKTYSPLCGFLRQ